MSTVIFAQYMAAPVLMTASLTAFMAFVQAMPAADLEEPSGLGAELLNVTTTPR